MTKGKGKFAAKGKDILGGGVQRPKNIDDFLGDADELSEKVIEKETEQLQAVEVEDQKQGKPEKEPGKVRQELRLRAELHEALRVYAFENRTTKTAVVEAALDAYFKGLANGSGQN